MIARRPLILAAAVLIGAAGVTREARAQEAVEHFQIDPSHTFPGFEVSHLGFSFHRGRFNTTAGRVVLDRAARRGEIAITMDAGSLDTGDAALEKELQGPNFFDAERHPTLRFSSEQLLFNDEGKLTGAHGYLTLLGVTRPITLRVTHFGCGTHPLTRKYTCGANAVTELLRSEFGMNKYVPFVGDEVRITLQIEAVRDTAPSE